MLTQAIVEYSTLEGLALLQANDVTVAISHEALIRRAHLEMKLIVYNDRSNDSSDRDNTAVHYTVQTKGRCCRFHPSHHEVAAGVRCGSIALVRYLDRLALREKEIQSMPSPA